MASATPPTSARITNPQRSSYSGGVSVPWRQPQILRFKYRMKVLHALSHGHCSCSKWSQCFWHAASTINTGHCSCNTARIIYPETGLLGWSQHSYRYFHYQQSVFLVCRQDRRLTITGHCSCNTARNIYPEQALFGRSQYHKYYFKYYQ